MKISRTKQIFYVDDFPYLLLHIPESTKSISSMNLDDYKCYKSKSFQILYEIFYWCCLPDPLLLDYSSSDLQDCMDKKII